MDVTSVRERFLPLNLMGFSTLDWREGICPEGELTRRMSVEAGRVWMGGSELLPVDMLFKEGVLKA